MTAPSRFVTILIALVLLLTAGAASATNYWASASGGSTDVRDGDKGHPWTLEFANSQLQAGDFLYLNDGAYPESIACWPLNNGTPLAPITYIGHPGIAAAVNVYGCFSGSECPPSQATTVYSYSHSALHGQYAVFKYMKCRNAIGTGQSLFNPDPNGYYYNGGRGSKWIGITYAGKTSVMGTECVYDSNTVTYTGPDAGIFGLSEFPWLQPTRNRITNCTFTYTLTGNADKHLIDFYRGYSNVIAFNTFNFTTTSTTGYLFDMEIYQSCNNLIQGNVWNLNHSGVIGGTPFIFSQRDSSHHNRVVGNIFRITSTTSGAKPMNGFALSQSGRPVSDDGMNYNYFGYNRVKATGLAMGALVWYNKSRGDTVEYNVISSTGSPAVSDGIGSVHDSLVFRHNTLWSDMATTINLQKTPQWSGSNAYSNIVYATRRNASDSATVQLPNIGGASAFGCVFALGGTAANAFAYGAAATHVAPIGPGQNWASPRLVDSTFSAADTTFNAALLATSNAFGPGYVDQYCGAIGTASYQLPPAGLWASTTLTATTELRWVVPMGAVSYLGMVLDLASDPDADFDTGTPIQFLPAAGPWGSEQTAVISLDSSTIGHYVSLKAVNAQGTPSAVSWVKIPVASGRPSGQLPGVDY